MQAKKDYSFHGVSMTQTEFAAAMAQKNAGNCPFCFKELSSYYGNANKHLRFCPKRPHRKAAFDAIDLEQA